MLNFLESLGELVVC